jgi:pyrroloquinoline-quinone synthase
MATRIAAWEQHYPWIDPGALDYFRSRLSHAPKDAAHALEFVIGEATTMDAQARCINALRRKTEILWHILDCIQAAYVEHDHSDSRTEPPKISV